jgi:Protein of unknown function (DUF1566)
MKHANYFPLFMVACICLSLTVQAAESLSYPIVETGQEGIGLKATYQDNKDGTISDLSTGLMWVKARGERLPWNDAMSGAKTCKVGTYSDWRMPTIKELYSLILFTGNDGRGFDSYEGFIPYINTNYFGFIYGDISKGARVIDCQDWSSTIYLGPDFRGGRKIFGVNFADGRIKGYSDSSPRGGMPMKLYVRYVRGNPKYGKNNFISTGNATITDRATGLLWTKEDSKKGMNMAEAEAWIKELNSNKHLGFTDWRLPTCKELHSIVEYTRSPTATQSAAINPLFSVSTITNEAGEKDYPCYWTSTAHGTVPRPGPAGNAGIYIAFGRAMGFMNSRWTDVHGAGAQRSDPKAGNPDNFPQGRGPQGDAVRIYNYVRPVRSISS